MLRRFFLNVFLLLAYFCVAQNNTKLDSLFSRLKATGQDTIRAQILHEICIEYQKGGSEFLLKNAEEMLRLSSKLNYLKGRSQAYNHIAKYYELQEDLNSALKYQVLNYQTCFERGDSMAIASAYHNIAWVYECLNLHDKALEYSFKKVRIIHNVKPPDYNKKLIPIYQIIGVIYKNKKMHDSATHYLDLAYKLAIQESDIERISSLLVNKGIVYEETGAYFKAEKVYLPAVEIALKTNSTNNLSGAYQGLANVYLHTKRNKKAIEFAGKALSLALQSGHKLWELYCYDVLIEAYKNEKDYEKALVYSERLRLIKDSINIQTNTQEIIRLHTKIETTEKEKQIVLLEKNKALALSKASANQLKITIALFISVLVIGLFAFLLWRNKRIRIQKETEFAKTKVILEHQAMRVQMNPHFIFNSLNSIQRLFVEGETDKASDVIADFSVLLRRILNNSSESEISLKEELDTLKLYMDIEKTRCRGCFNYNFIVDDKIDLVNTKVPPLVLQPFAENAIWHGILPSKKQGLISIKVAYAGANRILCEVKDNGVGIKPGAMDKPASRGLKITRDRLGSDIALQAAEDGGTLVTFFISI